MIFSENRFALFQAHNCVRRWIASCRMWRHRLPSKRMPAAGWLVWAKAAAYCLKSMRCGGYWRS